MSINSMERAPQKQKLPRGVEISSSIEPGFNHPENGAIDQSDVTAEAPMIRDHTSRYEAEVLRGSVTSQRRVGAAALSRNIKPNKR